MKPAIEIKNLGKVYNISHEQQASAGNVTFRDTLMGMVRKPVELITGHQLEKEKFWALKDVSFDINPGEVVGIIGRNGSGKSTLLKVLSRITDPTTGEIIMRGKVASLLEVGTGFHPELTGRENVFFNGAILGMSQKEIRSKFKEIVEFSEVEQFLDTPVKFYSSGMYVRLAFAVAAHLDPDILIIDEVLAVGDAAFQEKCLGKMKDVASQGRTVLFVSHSMPSIKSLCNKAVWMDKGQVREQGDLETVTDHYATSTLGGNIDLAKRKRETAVTGEATIVGIKVTSEGQTNNLVNSKKPLTFTLDINSTKELDNIIVHCAVRSGGAMGEPVLSFLSEHTNTTFDLKKGRNTIVCKTAPTNLVGGVYSVACSILRPGQEAMGHIDEIYDATTFAVNDFEAPANDCYVGQNEAMYFVDRSWSKEK